MDNYKKKYLKYKLKYLNLKSSSKVNNNFNKQSSKINYTLMKGGMTPAVSLEDRLNDYLKTYLNLKNEDVDGDGSCQFHAVIHQLDTYFSKKVDESGQRYTSDSLREKVVEHMNTMANGTEEQKLNLNTAARWEWAVGHHLSDSKIEEMEKKDELANSYIEAMKESCEYGDNTTLGIISEILQINIILINLTEGGSVPRKVLENKTYKDTITITLRGEHYQSTIKLERDEKLEHLKLKLKNMQFDSYDSDDNDLILSKLDQEFYDQDLYTLIDMLENIDEAIKFFKVNVQNYLRLINKNNIGGLRRTGNDSLNDNLKEVLDKGFTAYYKEQMLRFIQTKTQKEQDSDKWRTRIPNESEIEYVADNLENIDNVYDFLYYNQDLLHYLIDARISYHDLVKEELKKCFKEANEDFDTYKITAQTKANEIKTKVEDANKLKEPSYGSKPPLPSASLFESPASESPVVPPQSASLFESSAAAPKEPAPKEPVVPPLPSAPKEPSVSKASAPSVSKASKASTTSASSPPSASTASKTSASTASKASAPPPTSVPKSSFQSSNSKSDPYKLSQEALDAMAVVGGGVSIIILFILTISVN